MRFIIILATMLLSAVSSMAQLNGDGYYRIQNAKTLRYVYVTDDKGKLNYATSTADMYAIQLWLGFDKASSDPATVCYIKNVDGKYDIQAQGTGIYEIIQTYVNLRKNSNGTYKAYGSKDGFTKYLGDGEQADCDDGVMSSETKGEYQNWNIIPISTDDNAYFGVKGEISASGKYYRPFYAEFAYTFASSGMKAWYVDKVDHGMAVMKEITDGVPGETPVFIETSSDQPINCKLNIGASTGAAPAGNMLRGVYFDNPMKSHYNRVAFDPATMRMLGITSEGKLGYITPQLDFIPANRTYLSVPEGTPAELRLVTQAEYDEYMSEYFAQSISLNTTTASIVANSELQLTATVLPEKAASQTLTWSSSNTAVATVDGNGLVKGIAPGTATISVTTTDGSNLTATCLLTVTKLLASSITLSHTTASIVEDSELQLTATVLPEKAASQTLTWSSSNTAVATVDGNGLVKGIAPGTATISVTTTDGTNLSASCEFVVTKQLATSISLSETTARIIVANVWRLTPTVLPEKASSQELKWESSDPSIATIDDTGLITAKFPGTCTVSVTTTDGSDLTATCFVTSIPRDASSITLDQTAISGVPGTQVQLVATVKPEDAALQELIWESSDEAVATVDGTGLVTIVKEGEAVITVSTTDASNLSASCTVTGISGIESIFAAAKSTTVDIYTVGGVLLKKNATISDALQLAPGCYIIGSTKVLIMK